MSRAVEPGAQVDEAAPSLCGGDYFCKDSGTGKEGGHHLFRGLRGLIGLGVDAGCMPTALYALCPYHANVICLSARFCSSIASCLPDEVLIGTMIIAAQCNFIQTSQIVKCTALEAWLKMMS